MLICKYANVQIENIILQTLKNSTGKNYKRAFLHICKLAH